MWELIRQNKITVGLIVAVLALVLNSALDGCSTRNRVREAVDSAWAWKKTHDLSQKKWEDRDKEWQKVFNEAEKRRVVASRPPRPVPISESDLVIRFRELGYEGRVR